MKVPYFNSMYKQLTNKNGKEYFEEIIQYEGCIFLQLTEKQYNELVKLLLSWNYEIVDKRGKKYVKLPNGLLLAINETVKESA